jgi:hypothetical protein
MCPVCGRLGLSCWLGLRSSVSDVQPHRRSTGDPQRDALAAATPPHRPSHRCPPRPPRWCRSRSTRVEGGGAWRRPAPMDRRGGAPFTQRRDNPGEANEPSSNAPKMGKSVAVKALPVSLRTVWRKTRCHKPTNPLQRNELRRNIALHGMQGGSGSSPLGSISRSQAQPGFFNALDQGVAPGASERSAPMTATLSAAPSSAASGKAASAAAWCGGCSTTL